jgi:hypothetical protein
MKSVTFAGHEFSPELDNKPLLKFYMKKLVLCIYGIMPRIFGFDG